MESRTLNLTQSFDLETWSALGLSEIEAALNQWIPVDAPANLSEPMKYAVLGGGKRLRSLLVLGAFDAGIRDQDLNERGWRREADSRLLTGP